MISGLISDTTVPEGLAFLGMPYLRPKAALPAVLARVGSLELRMAESPEELRRVQQLRYDVFYGSGQAVADAFKAAIGLDTCPFDAFCDHVYVSDAEGRIVGTYRLLRGDVAAAQDGFYSETEFQLGPLLARHRGKRFLELGRSCVHPDFRSRRVIDLLWHGVSRYASHHGSDVLIGCASLPGTRAAELALPLGFACHHAATPDEWQVKAHPRRAARMDWLHRDEVDPRAAFQAMPPLMKAYVRAGAAFASEAAVDHEFGTTDLFTVLPLTEAAPRYVARFGLATAAA